MNGSRFYLRGSLGSMKDKEEAATRVSEYAAIPLAFLQVAYEVLLKELPAYNDVSDLYHPK